MNGLMKIQEFSNRTAIPKSSLRYYEEQGLLLPKRHRNNHYRLYHEAQIQTARMCASLRFAGISIEHIRQYVEANEDKQQSMVAEWRKELKKRKQQLDISLQYLAGTQQKQVYLMEKSAEWMVWFEAAAKPGQFYTHFQRNMKLLRNMGISIDSSYLQYISGKDLIQARIGFTVSETQASKLQQQQFYCTQMPATVVLGMPFDARFQKIADGYTMLLQHVQEHNWIPTGAMMEWYPHTDLTDMMIIVPVMQLGEGISDEVRR
ncbi:MerR family transcriptional regulator [Ornithinibacillus gellani]|uniref:MerR family transcriptional regulator n=1 Tax=Ornithinibacillus gellani TaxID=2293253 RepID=UPI000F469FC3|nr:MerR family transcriptional regulator [Ornithinibacillus gellani]TQS74107.1 MerR family transcriptional regulator [Ornithinibacillus gellani]